MLGHGTLEAPCLFRCALSLSPRLAGLFTLRGHTRRRDGSPTLVRSTTRHHPPIDSPHPHHVRATFTHGWCLSALRNGDSRYQCAHRVPDIGRRPERLCRVPGMRIGRSSRITLYDSVLPMDHDGTPRTVRFRDSPRVSPLWNDRPRRRGFLPGLRGNRDRVLPPVRITATSGSAATSDEGSYAAEHPEMHSP